MKFATKLTSAIALVSVITVPALGTAIFYLTRNIIQERITADQLRQTQSILNDIDRALYNAYQDVELISKDSQLESIINLTNESGKATFAEEIQHRHADHLNNKIRLTGPWDLINILDTRGRIVYSSQSENTGKSIRQYSVDRAAHYAALSGQHYYSDLIDSRLIIRPTIIFSAPIRRKNSGTIVGTVVGHFAWPIILQILDRTHSSNQIQMFDKRGTVIAVPSEQKNNILKTSLSKLDLVKQVFNEGRVSSGVITLNDRDGAVLATVIMQEGYLSFRGNDWGLLLGVPTKIAFASVAQLAQNITILILVLLAAIISIVYLLAKRIAHPIELLKNATIEIGRGNFDFPIDVKSGDEIEDLSDQFVQMAKDRKQAELELREAQFKLIRNERLATLGQLSATVSHELRNPLGAMRPALYILKKNIPSDNEKVENAFTRLDRNIDRCDQIIDEMLDFTRIEKLQPRQLVFDQWLSKELNDLPVPEGIKMQCDFQLDQTEVLFDPNHMRRALINLYDNACDSMLERIHKDQSPEDMLLAVKTKISNHNVEMEISDTGSGMPEEILAHIFEPLYSTKSFGVGLGLPAVKKILEEHKGGIKVYTEINKGTRMLMWIPVTSEL
jgi:signal transduction histidine kinase